MVNKNILWVEKYRPATLDQYVFHDNTHKIAFEQMVNTRTLPHLLLSGSCGTGKTTLAKILINSLNIDDTDHLLINASDENSVDDIRDKVKGFISSVALSDIKIVQLEEADYLSQPAQAILRKYMEEFNEQARFILTCNYEHKIIPPLRSRVQQYRFTASNRDEITEFAAKILIAEGVQFNIELLDRYIAVGYPDIRKIIQLLQQNTIDGVLMSTTVQSESNDYKFKLIEFISNDQWPAARKLCCDNVATEEWEDLYKFLYLNLHKSSKFSDNTKWENGIVTIAEHLYKHGLIADPEINGAAMFIRLSQI